MNNVGFKDSGVQWLGEIPQHWEVRKLKFVAKEIISGGTPNTSKSEFWSESEKDSYLWVSIEDMTNADFIKTTKKCITKKGLENSSARIIPPYSIFYSIYASLGKISYSNKYLTTNQAILGIVTKEFYFYKYCFYSLMSLTKTLISLSNKTTQDNINLDILRNIKIPLPPLDEQRRIAEFLDSKCAKIAEFINAKQKIISLLKEQKLALINESVCGRIHTHKDNQTRFKFKHSGIEWLGEIPQHWEVRKLKSIANFDKGLNITKENLRDNGIFVLSYGEIHSKYPFEVNPQIHQLKCVDENYLNTNSNSLLRKGDFVFADTSEDIIGSGNFSFLNSEIPTFAGYHTIICRIQNVDCHESANADSRNDKHSTPSLRVSEANAAIHKISAKFLAYEFESSIFRSQIQKNVNGVKVYSITQNILKDCAVWLPPLNEQRRIAEFLDKKCEKIDKAIALIEQEIQAIKEYKTSLIDKAVRGGINV